FNTHEGSGQSGTQRVIENALPNSTVLPGLAIQGKVAQEDAERTRELVDTWLEGLGMKRATTEEAQILAAYEAIQQAMIDKDIDTLDRLYLDGTTFTHMSGKVQTKEEFFGEIADGTLNYFAYDIQNPKITVDGDEATLSASVALTAKVYGASGTWTLPVNAHFTRIDGQWYAHN
ncbi:MAG: nuclear transport factor 2 family protein, partial [Clostridia bacterium]|nr:nuclear transport factor 2 family protein [Clostridia bacterium]